MTQWRDKFNEFAPDLSSHILRKGTPYELPRFFGRTPDVVISSYGRTTGGWAKILAEYCNLVVFDEVQELRHMDTDRYKAAWELCQGIAYRLGLSATPIYNYGGEIFSIINLLRPGVLGDYFEFTTEWCSNGGQKAKLEDPKAFGTWARDNFVIVRHTRKEVGRELPAVTRIVQPIDSDSEQLATIKNAAADLARLILTSDTLEKGVKWEASRDLSVMLRKFTGIGKAPYAAEFVRMLLEQGEKVVLCGWHRQVYDIWLERLAEFNPILYTGTETPAEKAAAKKKFVDGDAQVLILSLRSGAGLDGLQEACNTIVFGELDWSDGVHEQCIGRIARDGQVDPVMAYFLVSNDGSDPTVVEMLGLKREQKEGIMNPTRDFLERLDDGGDHVKRLAEAYLKQIGQRMPVERITA
jgi:SNF2 family DNA or RNA helicase